eukprot:COSAG02_NODE_28617_length_586_cov_0.848049_1_plen_37_part_01
MITGAHGIYQWVLRTPYDSNPEVLVPILLTGAKKQTF